MILRIVVSGAYVDNLLILTRLARSSLHGDDTIGIFCHWITIFRCCNTQNPHCWHKKPSISGNKVNSRTSKLSSTILKQTFLISGESPIARNASLLFKKPNCSLDHHKVCCIKILKFEQQSFLSIRGVASNRMWTVIKTLIIPCPKISFYPISSGRPSKPIILLICHPRRMPVLSGCDLQANYKATNIFLDTSINLVAAPWCWSFANNSKSVKFLLFS